MDTFSSNLFIGFHGKVCSILAEVHTTELIGKQLDTAIVVSYFTLHMIYIFFNEWKIP